MSNVKAALFGRDGDTVFECGVCGDQFTEDVWHCPFCSHHWSKQFDSICKNCYSDRPPQVFYDKLIGLMKTIKQEGV